MRMDKSCCWKGDFLAFWCGKVGILVGACGRAVGVKGQNVLVLWRLFGFVARESHLFSWLGPTMRMDKSCCWKGDFLAFWCGKVGILVGACGRAVVRAPFAHVDP